VEGDNDRRRLQRQLAVVRRVATPATSASECERLRLRTAGKRSGHKDTCTVPSRELYALLNDTERPGLLDLVDFVHRLVF
jgi:hypothetical protein